MFPLLSPPLGYREYPGVCWPLQWAWTRHGDLPPDRGRSAAHFSKLYTGSTGPVTECFDIVLNNTETP